MRCALRQGVGGVLEGHGVCKGSLLRRALHVCAVQSALRAVGATVEVHGCFLGPAGTGGWGLFDRSSKHCQQACTGAQWRGVGAVALRRRVQTVDCAPDVLSLRNFDAVGEDLDGQRVVGYFLSIRIQLGGAGVARRSHLLCGFPSRRSSVHLQAQKRGGRVCRGWQTGQHIRGPLSTHEPGLLTMSAQRQDKGRFIFRVEEAQMRL